MPAGEGWSLAELDLVAYLRAVGHEVRPGRRLPTGRVHDAFVDGEVVEFKVPDPGATNRTLVNRANESKRMGGQARILVFDLRPAQMSRREALRGVARTRGAYSKYYDRVRVIGLDYDVTEEMEP